MTPEMILYAGLSAGVDFDSAMIMPLTMLEDIIATHQIMTQGYNRVYTDPKDIENDFLQTMSAR